MRDYFDWNVLKKKINQNKRKKDNYEKILLGPNDGLIGVRLLPNSTASVEETPKNKIKKYLNRIKNIHTIKCRGFLSN
jgi:hypothetical protein